MKLFAAGIFLSAFLLFLVQPMIGKYILPWFGSTPGVWTVCLLFFQVVLLLGYAYAHFLVSRFGIRGQAVTHLVLLALALLTLPITPAASWKPDADTRPTLQILLLLLTSVGAPFLLLSATGPLLQGWFSRVHPDRSPYRLYSLSNAGSLLGLLIYPFVIERFLRLDAQTVGWSAGWVLSAVVVGALALRILRSPRPGPVEIGEVEETSARPGLLRIALWMSLAACGSGLLMATTNRLCLDVAVFPLLWIVPLSLYLSTFIICFDHERWYRRSLFFLLLPLAMLAAVVSMREGVELSALMQVGLGVFTLFVCCMCCHGELTRRKPHPRYLTLFYLAVAFGGAVGGLFVAVVAPLVFRGFYEYPLLLGVTYLTVGGVAARDLMRPLPAGSRPFVIRTWDGIGWGGFILVVLILTALTFDRDLWPGELDGVAAETTLRTVWVGGLLVVVLIPVLALIGGGRAHLANLWVPEARRSHRKLAQLLILCALLISLVPLIGSLVFEILADQDRQTVIARDRNFYGVLSVEEYDRYGSDHDLTLVHGRIQHGLQLQVGEMRAWPTTYYGPGTGVGLAIREHPARRREGRQFRIGVVGLGAGTLAAYANARVERDDEMGEYVTTVRRAPGDFVAFYDINPLVIDWALSHFTFIEDAALRGAVVSLRTGDARIVLERELKAGRPGRFDVLAVDAFSSDAIPVHLLTRECFTIYDRHLAEGGILAIHITNRYLNLEPVVCRIAEELGFLAITVANDDDLALAVDASDWVLLTRSREFMEDPEVDGAGMPLGAPGPLWTDDFSSIIPLLR